MVALLIAGLSIVLVLSSRLFSWLENSRLRKFVFAIVGCIFVFAVLDFSVGVGSSDPEGWTNLGIWVFTVGLWVSGSFWLNDSCRRRWIKWRSTALVIYTPFFLLAFWDAYNTRRLIGLLLFLIGITLLMIGFVQLQWRLTQGTTLPSGKPPPEN
jgi:hypothetical protein